MATVKLTKDNFETEVLKAEGKVLVDFWATWCGPCQMVGPILEEISEEVDIKIGKVNTDEEMELAGMYRIVSIPTLLVFENGEIVNHMVGAGMKEDILEILK